MERERCHGQTATVIREASATDLCMAGDFSCTEMGPGEVTGQDGQEERRVTDSAKFSHTCIFNI